MIIFAELHLPVIVFQSAHMAVQLGGSMNIVVILMKLSLHTDRGGRKYRR